MKEEFGRRGMQAIEDLRRADELKQNYVEDIHTRRDLKGVNRRKKLTVLRNWQDDEHRARYGSHLQDSQSTGSDGGLEARQERKEFRVDLKQINEIDKEERGYQALLHSTELLSNIDNLEQQYETSGVPVTSPLLNFYMQLRKAKVNVNMRSFGFINKVDNCLLELNQFQFMPEYVDPFVASVGLSTQLRVLRIRQCKLPAEAVHLLANIPPLIEEIDLSDNPQLGPAAGHFMAEHILAREKEIQSGFGVGKKRIVQYFGRLKTVVLQGCSIGDEGTAAIVEALKQKERHLNMLDLSKNGLTPEGAESIAELIAANTDLSVLFLHFNNFGPIGSELIASALAKNGSLQVLDVSFCGLGKRKKPREHKKPKDPDASPNKKDEKKIPSPAPTPKLSDSMPPGPERIAQLELEKRQAVHVKQQKARALMLIPPKRRHMLDMQTAEAWSGAFLENRSLLHLDLSHNAFDARELAVMKDGLDENHTLMGIHLEGNEGSIDALGFMQPHDLKGMIDREDPFRYHIFTRISPELKMGACKTKTRVALKATSNCWICEGWSEYLFEFRPLQMVDVDTVPVRLHLSCDDYKGELLNVGDPSSTPVQKNKISIAQSGEERLGQLYRVRRMLPPGPIYYYFTVNGEVQLNDQDTQLDTSLLVDKIGHVPEVEKTPEQLFKE